MPQVPGQPVQQYMALMRAPQRGCFSLPSSPHGQELYGGVWPRLAHRWDQVLATGFTLNETGCKDDINVHRVRTKSKFGLGSPPSDVSGMDLRISLQGVSKDAQLAGCGSCFLSTPRLLSPEARRVPAEVTQMGWTHLPKADRPKSTAGPT